MRLWYSPLVSHPTQICLREPCRLSLEGFVFAVVHFFFSCCDVSVTWLRAAAPQLRREYPQLSPLKFDLSKEPNNTPLTKEQFKALLGGIALLCANQNAPAAQVFLLLIISASVTPSMGCSLLLPVFLRAEKIDAAYRSPAPTAQNARQAGAYLAKCFNDGFAKDAPAFCEKWKGSLAYVGATHRHPALYSALY